MSPPRPPSHAWYTATSCVLSWILERYARFSHARGKWSAARIKCATRASTSPVKLPASRSVVVRGSDNILRGFFNVCRHHAAAVITKPEGTANNLRCPYHGWTYDLEGSARSTRRNLAASPISTAAPMVLFRFRSPSGRLGVCEAAAPEIRRSKIFSAKISLNDLNA